MDLDEARVGVDADDVDDHIDRAEGVENLDLSVRVFNSLKRAGIVTVGEVLELLEKGEDAIMSIRNFGDKSMDELVDKMSDKGYLKSDEDEAAETEAE